MIERTAQVDALIERGLSLYEAGDVDHALLAWEEALNLDPNNARANGYVDYVRLHYETLSGGGPDIHPTMEPYAVETTALPSYRIAIAPISVGGAASKRVEVIEGVDEGWFLESDPVVSPHPMPAEQSASETRAASTNARVIASGPTAVALSPLLSPALIAQEVGVAVEEPQPLPDAEDDGADIDDDDREALDLPIAPSWRKVASVVAPQPVGESSGQVIATMDDVLSGEFEVRAREVPMSTPPPVSVAPELVSNSSDDDGPPVLSLEASDPDDGGVGDQLDAMMTGNAFEQAPRFSSLDEAYEDMELAAAPVNGATTAPPVEPSRINAPATSPSPVDDDDPPLPAFSSRSKRKSNAPELQLTLRTPSSLDDIELHPVISASTAAEPAKRPHRATEPFVGARRAELASSLRDLGNQSAAVVESSAPLVSRSRTKSDLYPINADPRVKPADERQPALEAKNEPEIEVTGDLTPSAPTRRLEQAAKAAAAAGDPFVARALELQQAVDLHAPPDETAEDRLRRRITGLLQMAEESAAKSDLERGVVCIDLALGQDPHSALGQKLVHRHRDTILSVLQQYLGNMDRLAVTGRPMQELAQTPISPRAAFLLSRVDGAISFDELLDVSGMPRLEAHRYLCQLVMRGFLR